MCGRWRQGFLQHRGAAWGLERGGHLRKVTQSPCREGASEGPATGGLRRGVGSLLNEPCFLQGYEGLGGAPPCQDLVGPSHLWDPSTPQQA